MKSDFTQILEARLSALKDLASHGIIPGQLDTFEMQQLQGRIKELTLVLKILHSQDLAAILQGEKNDNQE